MKYDHIIIKIIIIKGNNYNYNIKYKVIYSFNTQNE